MEIGSAPEARPARILIVDDQRSIRAFVRAVLAPLQAEISESGIGEDALGLIATESFDCVLLDINLPAADGLEVCRLVRQLIGKKELPIIVMTGIVDKEIVVRAFSVGATDYVSKPLRPQELLARTKACIARYNAERALFNAKKEAEQANIAKSEFISSMSHELRTPLNAILGFGQLMETDDRVPMVEAHKEYVQEILGAGWHLLKLINDILDLSKVEAGVLAFSPVAVNVDRLVQNCMNYNSALAARHAVTLSYSPEQTGCMVQTDETRLTQVLVNLISNAVKYNRAGGSVLVKTSRPRSGALRIAVEDTGLGITEDKLEKLFQPFNRLGAEHTAIEGSGIGLALTKKIVEGLHGRIGVESQPNVGSLFWVEFDQDSPFLD
ncbi:MAG: hybrid sensor histidine kinase/response regulator [Methylococcaceae bacterium]|nr:MAG: hybrid sensor histidine kinase/response regulator [Methylococcaceae bacterium]